MGDKNKGLYGKFIVTRTDGQSDKGMKHDKCEYFVLDLTHDPYAIPALKAYQEACEDQYPYLAKDLKRKIAELELLQTAWANDIYC